MNPKRTHLRPTPSVHRPRRPRPAISRLRAHCLLAASLLAASLLTAPAAWAICTGPPALEAAIKAHPDPNSYAALGAWFGENSQFACAVETLRAGLHANPSSMRLNYLLGLTLYSAGQEEDALSPLQRAAQLDTRALEPHLILAAALDQLQRHPEARIQWQAALRIDPASPVALNGLSQSLIAAGDYKSAITLLRTARLNEDLALNLAQAYSKSGQSEQASQTLQAALRTHPNSTRITNALARAYSQTGQSDKAIQMLKQLLRAHPDDVDAQRICLPLLVITGDMAAARPMAAQLLARFPNDFDILFLSGVVANQASQFPAARDYLEKALALSPNDSSSHYYLGLTLSSLDDLPGARAHLERSLTLNPSNPEAHFQLASVLRNLGEKDLAQQQSRIAQHQFAIKAQRTLGDLKAAEAARKLAAKDFPGAIATYREATTIAPEDANIAYHLALAYDRAGDLEAERTALEHTLQLDPTMTLAQNQLGFVLSRAGDVAEAEKHFRLAVQSSPAFTEGWVNLAAALAMQSRLREAQQALAQALHLEPANAQALGLQKDLAAQ